MRSLFVVLAVMLTPATELLAAPPGTTSCPANAHADSRGVCVCNTGYAFAKGGACVLKRAVIDPPPEAIKKNDKAPKTEKP